MRRCARTDVRGGAGGFPGRHGGTGAGTSLARPRRVLYIERDSFTAAMTRATLEDAGFEVDWFPVPEAMRPPAVGRYDVCLLAPDRPGSRNTAGLADLAGGARVVLLGSDRDSSAAGGGEWVLARPHAPELLARTVELAARERPRAA